MAKFELDGRYLIKRHASQSEPIEVTITERSPDGKFVNGGKAGWVDVSEAVVLVELPKVQEPVKPKFWWFVR